MDKFREQREAELMAIPKSTLALRIRFLEEKTQSHERAISDLMDQIAVLKH